MSAIPARLVMFALSPQLNLIYQNESPSAPAGFPAVLGILPFRHGIQLSLSVLQVSVGGRDNFLAAESDKTIALMIDCCSETKVATALLAQAQHKSPQVRAKVASHLDSLMQGDHGLRLAGVLPTFATCHICYGWRQQSLCCFPDCRIDCLSEAAQAHMTFTP